MSCVHGSPILGTHTPSLLLACNERFGLRRATVVGSFEAGDFDRDRGAQYADMQGPRRPVDEWHLSGEVSANLLTRLVDPSSKSDR
jgi:hypothetical protein